MHLSVGSSRKKINCAVGDHLAGQLSPRVCGRIRDDLEANFLYLSDGQEAVLLASLDLLALETAYAAEVREAIAARTGVPARGVILTCTHTHDGPDTMGLLHDVAPNAAYLERLRGWLVDAAADAVEGARPARVGWAAGHAHIGYNRRVTWSDGSHTMYGDTGRPEFTGLEGPDDPSHSVLFAVDADGRLIGLAHANCCHSTCMESAAFASADFAGEARALLRTALGPDLPVLYLQGASGDTSPWNLMQHPRHHHGERRAREIACVLAGETLRLLAGAPTTDTPVLRHCWEDTVLAVRLPNPEALDRARQTLAMGEEQAGRGRFVLDVDGVLALQERFGANPVESVPIHVVRVGDFALATNPCELYCQFGLDIKRRSPAAVTAVAQLADGFSGYCPTIPALMGGGYSGDPMLWCRLEPYAGYKIVEAGARLLHQAWRG